MEKLKIIPPDAQIYAQVKASWDKIAKPLDGLGQFETMFAHPPRSAQSQEAAAFPLKKK